MYVNKAFCSIVYIYFSRLIHVLCVDPLYLRPPYLVPRNTAGGPVG